MGIGISNNNLVFTNSESAESGGAFNITVQGGIQSRIKVELVDIYVDSEGLRRALPLRSTPYTANELVTFSSSLPDYIPNGRRQNIAIPFKFVNLKSARGPVLGGLKISIIPENTEATASVINSSVVATFAYLPEGELAADYYPNISITNASLESASSDAFPWSLIPNLPSIFSTPNLVANVKSVNSGEIFFVSRTKLSLTPINILGAPVGKKSVLSESETLLVLPGQISDSAVYLIEADLPKNDAETVQTIGLFQVEIEVTGEIDSRTLTSDKEFLTIVVFPWKPLFAALVILVLIRRPIVSIYRLVISGAKSRHAAKTVDLNLESFREKFSKAPNHLPNTLDGSTIARQFSSNVRMFISQASSNFSLVFQAAHLRIVSPSIKTIKGIWTKAVTPLAPKGKVESVSPGEAEFQAWLEKSQNTLKGVIEPDEIAGGRTAETKPTKPKGSSKNRLEKSRDTMSRANRELGSTKTITSSSKQKTPRNN